jgi:hypothetical protein
VNQFAAQHIVLPRAHGDHGDTPRAVGSASAIGQGFDAIAYLDVDNQYHPKHIESLVRLHEETGAPVCTSTRSFHHLDTGRLLGYPARTDGRTFCDTSCLMLFRPALHLALQWALIDPAEHVVGDRVMWERIVGSGVDRAHTGRHTVGYRVQNAAVYEMLRLPVPAGAARPTTDREIGRALRRRIERGAPLPSPRADAK